MRWPMVALCLMWGLNWTVMKEANVFFSPVVFTAYRFVLAAFVLLGVQWYMKVPLPKREDWLWIVVTGIFQTAFLNTAIQVGMKHLSSGLSALLTYSMPFWVTVLAHFLLGEKLTVRKLVGVSLGTVGLAAVLNVRGGGEWWAVLLTLGGALAWALANVLVKLKLQYCNILQMTTWQMVAGAVAMVGYSLVTEQAATQWNWLAIGCLLYNGLLASGVAFILWTHILATTEAGKAAVSILVIPIIGVLSGALFLGETLHGNILLGMALILGGIWLVNRQGSRS